MKFDIKKPTHKEIVAMTLRDLANDVESGEEPKFFLELLKKESNNNCICGKPNCPNNKQETFRIQNNVTNNEIRNSFRDFLSRM